MIALSKNKIKYIRSLDSKKARKEEKVFLAEGTKIVNELIHIFECETIVATKDWYKAYPSIKANELIVVSDEELSKVSLLKTPQQVLAVFKQPNYTFDGSVIKEQLCIALDNIQDPGNLGTIIRIADWFGIEHIFCSIDTVDIYNPKVVQATMGAIARVKIQYTSLKDLIRNEGENVSIYGTFLDGENIYKYNLNNYGLIVMGNEGNGVSDEIRALVNEKLYIPNYPASRETSESLNVAIATAIVCAEFRRQVSSK